MKHYITLVFLVLIMVVFGCSNDETSTDENTQTQINKNLNRQTTGSSANDLLSSTTFKKMMIEMVYVEGFEPANATVDNFV